MAKALTKLERSDRHRIMAQFRNWIDQNELDRQDIAVQFGITPGHLRTLLNTNRTASEDQCQKALILMDAKFAVSKHDPRYKELGVKPLIKRKEMRPEPRKRRKATRKPNNLRPLTKAEGNFIKEVAEAWLGVNKGASQDDYVEIVRALGIGVRS
jgi:predicted XRE-type DNA-binding protein